MRTEHSKVSNIIDIKTGKKIEYIDFPRLGCKYKKNSIMLSPIMKIKSGIFQRNEYYFDLGDDARVVRYMMKDLDQLEYGWNYTKQVIDEAYDTSVE